MSKWEKPVLYLNDGVDRKRIRYLMRMRGDKLTDIATALGKDPSCISSKLNGRAPFMASDIDKLKNHFELSTAEAAEVFFGNWKAAN